MFTMSYQKYVGASVVSLLQKIMETPLFLLFLQIEIKELTTIFMFIFWNSILHSPIFAPLLPLVTVLKTTPDCPL